VVHDGVGRCGLGDGQGRQVPVVKDSESLLDQYLRLREEWYPWQPNFVSDMINYYRMKDRQDGSYDSSDGLMSLC